MNLGPFRRYQEQQAGRMEAQRPQVTDRRQFILDRQLESEKLAEADDVTLGDVTISGTLTLSTPAGGPFNQAGYPTADTTIAALTAAVLTHAFGTADGTVTDVGAAFNQTTLNDNFKELTDQHAKLLADLVDVKQALNALIDVFQARGDLT